MAYPPLVDRTLERFLNQRGGFDMLASRQFVHGPVIAKGTPTFWPIIAFKVEAKEELTLSARVGLFYEDGERRSSSDDVHALGWRFEAGDPGGRHGYFHAQAMNEWVKGESRLSLPVVHRVNATQPCFILHAESSVGLLCALVVSLYGMTEGADFLALASHSKGLSGLKSVVPGWCSAVA